MGPTFEKPVGCLVVDTTAFIQNASLQDVADTIVTCPEVIAEITNKRQLKRLVVLPYDLVVKDVFPENVKVVTEFSKKTGDYPSLSATDIKVMALTYQLEKEKVGTDHIRVEPIQQNAVVTTENRAPNTYLNVAGFYVPGKTKNIESKNEIEELNYVELVEEQTDESQGSTEDHIGSKKNVETEEGAEELPELIEEDTDLENDLPESLKDHTDSKNDAEHTDLKKDELFGDSPTLESAENDNENDDILVPVSSDEDVEDESEETDEEDDDDVGWITPLNVKQAKKQIDSELLEEKQVSVACMTTDFAMQNVLRQMNLSVSALDGRLIKQLRTYILRCYTCFKTTSIMTKMFCPKCGNNTLKKVAVSLDENGKMQIHINPKRPLTSRGKKFSLPKIRGGKHPNNPILVADQPMADNKPTRLARMKNNPMDDDYIAGASPFIMRDITSKSAKLCIRPGQEFKHWMKKNPNEARRKRK